MSTSQEMLEKSIITTESIASAGKLQSKQVKKLWTYIIEEDQELFGLVRSQGFSEPSWEMHRTAAGKRVGLAFREATDPQRRRKTVNDKITMEPGWITVPFEISHRMFEQSVDGDVENVIIKLMAAKLRTELKQIALWGNKLGAAALPSELDFTEMSDSAGVVKDELFAVQDGWFKQLLRTGGTVVKPATIVNATNASISSQLFSQAFRTLPQKYHKLGNSMKFLTSTSLDLLYNEKLMPRLTALGDQAVVGGNIGNAVARRMPLSTFDFQPRIVEHIVLNGTTATALQHKYWSTASVTVTSSTLDSVQTKPYTVTTDYVLDSAAGTVARNGGGTIADGATVKVTYLANPMMVLVDPKNLLLGYDLNEVRFLKGQNIYADTYEYVMHLKVAFGVENEEACVFVNNIATS
jgi:hypothetical protein